MKEDWLGLENKVVIVTGGAAGIGRSIGDCISACGAKVIIADMNVSDDDRIDEMYCVQCNVTDKASVERMVQKVVNNHGRIDALINNAGVIRPQLLVDLYGEKPEYEIDEVSFDFMFNVNVKGVVFCTQAVVRQMLKQGEGVILNVSSESGMEGSAGQSCYAATKGAVNTFTRSWAKELGSKNIRVLAVAPGIMEKTNMRTEAYNDALAYTRGCKSNQISTDYSKSIPLGREGELNEVGHLAAYLISDKASYITGTVVNISGGKSRG